MGRLPGARALSAAQTTQCYILLLLLCFKRVNIDIRFARTRTYALWSRIFLLAHATRCHCFTAARAAAHDDDDDDGSCKQCNNCVRGLSAPSDRNPLGILIIKQYSVCCTLFRADEKRSGVVVTMMTMTIMTMTMIDEHVLDPATVSRRVLNSKLPPRPQMSLRRGKRTTSRHRSLSLRLA